MLTLNSFYESLGKTDESEINVFSHHYPTLLVPGSN